MTEAKTLSGVMAGRRPDAGGGKKKDKRGAAKPDKGMPKPQPRPQRVDSRARGRARGKRTSPLLWIVPLAAVVIGGVAFLLVPKGVKVPELVGLSREQAEERLKGAGLELAVNGEKDAATLVRWFRSSR